VAVSNLVTAGPAWKLQISPIPLPIASDLNIYEITVTDKTGQRVMDATHEVTVKVEGGGKLTGVDNGDLKYTGLFKTEKRNAYQGRLLVTVQKTSSTNPAKIVVSAPGLSSCSTVFGGPL
jgi:beta-galactosidase